MGQSSIGRGGLAPRAFGQEFRDARASMLRNKMQPQQSEDNA
jgi:hypothetical protein